MNPEAHPDSNTLLAVADTGGQAISFLKKGILGFLPFRMTSSLQYFFEALDWTGDTAYQVCWGEIYVAIAMPRGVYLYNIPFNRIISVQGEPSSNLLYIQPTLKWRTGRTVIVAWGNSLKRVSVQDTYTEYVAAEEICTLEGCRIVDFEFFKDRTEVLLLCVENGPDKKPSDLVLYIVPVKQNGTAKKFISVKDLFEVSSCKVWSHMQLRQVTGDMYWIVSENTVASLRILPDL
eukprot:TRINITY_DN9046_c0_g2_i2.p1 TRINITY_DN9046_c0_g2~~TRINITY_DN9046_c0_g2_i2.p1  ORF type:complete len:268 (-),score=55.01 TRINITY_DN9046_c0_g2_i2:85-786(-)